MRGLKLERLTRPTAKRLCEMYRPNRTAWEQAELRCNDLRIRGGSFRIIAFA